MFQTANITRLGYPAEIKDSHTCVENAMRRNCPVCLQDVLCPAVCFFVSRICFVFFPRMPVVFSVYCSCPGSLPIRISSHHSSMRAHHSSGQLAANPVVARFVYRKVAKSCWKYGNGEMSAIVKLSRHCKMIKNAKVDPPQSVKFYLKVLPRGVCEGK